MYEVPLKVSSLIYSLIFIFTENDKDQVEVWCLIVKQVYLHNVKQGAFS